MELNAKKAEENKQLGLDLVETNNPSFLETIRSIARIMIRKQGPITNDQLREWYDDNSKKMCLPEPTSPNVWGGVFRAKEFIFIEHVKSKQVQGHGNRIGLWGLRESVNRG